MAFGDAIGGGSAILQAMQRRGLTGGAMNQQSPASAGGAPAIPQPVQGGGGVTPPPAGTPPVPVTPEMGGNPAIAPAPPGSNEADLIIKALSGRLQSDSKIKEAQVGVR